jgi:hypothetical protein
MAIAAYGAYHTGEWWVALLGSPGLVMIGNSILDRRGMRKDIMSLLEKETADMGYEELEKRVRDKNYEPSTRDEEKTQKNEMDAYARNLIGYVITKENSLANSVLTMAGLTTIVGGLYIARTGDSSARQLLGLTMSSIGVVITAFSGFKYLRKMRRLKKNVKRVLHDKGYDFFKLYANKKDPYDFYKRHILPEITGKPAASE